MNKSQLLQVLKNLFEKLIKNLKGFLKDLIKIFLS